jgi:MFS family permease
MGFTTPAGFGLIAEAFPERHRATANALYGSGVYFGGGLASLSALLTAKPMVIRCGSVWSGVHLSSCMLTSRSVHGS